MKAIFKRLLVILSLLVSTPVLAQTTAPKSQSALVADDRSPIRVRYPEAGHLRDRQTDHDYQYGNDAPPPDNAFDRFLNWLFRQFTTLLSSKAYQNVGQYVMLAAIAGLVIYLLMKAEVLHFLFPKQAQSASLDYENLTDNIHEINFEAAIDEAVSQQNLRLAVRLLYLQTLKRLTDADWITYQPDKTNQHYIYDLANTEIKPDFERLTRQFEFVWYGNFPIDQARFADIQQQFNQFGQVLKLQTAKS